LATGKQKLEAEIKRLEGLEKTLLKILHCNSIAQVNAKIQRYNSADNLSGLNLRKAFLAGMGGAVLVDPDALLRAL
jgi:hypothetical protein